MSRKGRPVSPDKPSPSVCKHGRRDTHSELTLPVGVKPTAPDAAKPPYRVPSMAEIEALPDNGFRVVSTFSGCGGSCLGYRMAGFRVLWANEFIPAAQETYRLNHPGTYLDTRDIRTVQPEEVLAQTGLAVGDIDLFDGSPPCASFSTAGKREAGWGQVKAYSDTRQRVDDLFFEYARLLRGLQPKTFVAENVSGLVKGTAKGYFKEISAALRACGYRVEAKLLDAQWLGVPQMRQRLIFVGVRNDLGLAPAFPKPLSYRYSVREAIPWIVEVEEQRGFDGHRMLSADTPNGTVGNDRPIACRAYRDKRGAFGHDSDITDQPAPTVLSGSVGTHWVEGGAEWEMVTAGNERHTLAGRPPTRQLGKPAPTITATGNEFDLIRSIEPETDMSGFADGEAWDAMEPGKAGRYFSLVKPQLDAPCNTVTARGGDSSAASVAHPTERRKFSIAELRRICAFPDDFQLVGTYAQQWERLGRAVPPVMMAAIATAVREGVLCRL